MHVATIIVVTKTISAVRGRGSLDPSAFRTYDSRLIKKTRKTQDTVTKVSKTPNENTKNNDDEGDARTDSIMSSRTLDFLSEG